MLMFRKRGCVRQLYKLMMFSISTHNSQMKQGALRTSEFWQAATEHEAVPCPRSDEG